MTKFIVDTNFIISLSNLDDSNHQLARQELHTISGNPVFIPNIVIAELAMATESARSYLLTAAVIVASKPIEHTRQDIDFLSKLDSSVKRKLKVADCILLALAYRYDAQIMTFDKQVLREAKGLQVSQLSPAKAKLDRIEILRLQAKFNSEQSGLDFQHTVRQ